METTSSDPENHAAQDLHKDVLPCVSAGEVPALAPQVDLTDHSWPFIGSLAVHAILFAVLSSPAFQYPIVIRSETPNIFWFSPISLPGTSEEPGQQLHGASVAFAAQQEPSDFGPKRQAPAESDAAVGSDDGESAPEKTAAAAEPELTVATPVPVKKTVVAVKQLKPPPDPPRHHTPEPTPPRVKSFSMPMEAEPESQTASPVMPPPAAMAVESQPSAHKKNRQDEDALASRQIVEQKQQDAEKLRRERMEREQELRAAEDRLRQERAAGEEDRRKQQAAENRLRREQELRAVQEALERDRAAAENARQKQLERENERQKQKLQEEAQHKREMERVARDTAERSLSALAVHQSNRLLPQPKKEPEPQNPVKPASLSLPLVKGDIKLVIAGAVLPDIQITFIDFAPSRRDRPFSRAEARRKKVIVPLVASIRNTTREVVIARVSPGVYTITATAADGPATVTLSLQLYEGTSRAVRRELGTHVITKRYLLCRILMPEGILWDDTSAFSGSMEDSDGVTKFNSETGLMWKEYAE
ncbi:MAG: hypothetical protein ACYDG4_09385 [Desulfuromonadaceae bacterium]